MKRILLAALALAFITGCDDLPTDNTGGSGAMTITFDDGWLSAYTRAYPALQAHGLRANVGVVTDHVDLNLEGFMTLEQLRVLHDAGWSMVTHTVSHPHLPTLTAGALEAELTGGRSWIDSHGFRGSNVFIVPFHDFGDRELVAIRRHFDAARINNASFYVPARFENWPPADPYALTSLEAELAPFTTPAGRAALEQQIEVALSAGKFVDILFHDITPDQLDAFEQTIAMLARFKDQIRPYHELFP
jgi:peptidoglycan/xylan/chitin deacetylase (PgdA/CDA1 family)